VSTTTFDHLNSRDRLRVWWAFMWRGFVVTICSTLAGAISGFIIGITVVFVAAVMAQLGHGFDTYLPARVLPGLAGIPIGLWFTWRYVRWIFRARLAGFRLCLVREPSGASV
jgi:ABC-type amino acid transport system permease subunit